MLKDGKLCQRLIGHTKGVWCVRFLSTTLLISGAYDTTIKVSKFTLQTFHVYFFSLLFLSFLISFRFGISIQVFVYELFCHIVVLYGHWHVQRCIAYRVRKIELLVELQLKRYNNHWIFPFIIIQLVVGSYMAFTKMWTSCNINLNKKSAFNNIHQMENFKFKADGGESWQNGVAQAQPKHPHIS